ncbi:MAG: hypothetical protein WDN75_10310 [Bacteroidota bacterium]
MKKIVLLISIVLSLISFYSGAQTPNPVHAASITHGTGGAVMDGPNSVYVSGNYAYLTGYNSNSLEIVDITNPSAPVHKAQLHTVQEELK